MPWAAHFGCMLQSPGKVGAGVVGARVGDRDGLALGDALGRGVGTSLHLMQSTPPAAGWYAALAPQKLKLEQ